MSLSAPQAYAGWGVNEACVTDLRGIAAFHHTDWASDKHIDGWHCTLSLLLLRYVSVNN